MLINKVWLVAATLIFVACSKEQVVDALRKAGVLDPAAQEKVTLDLVCDYGGGSSGCTSDSLQKALTQIVPTLAPGSVIRLYGMADRVADAKELARYTITAPPKKTRQAIADHRKQLTQSVLDTFTAAAAPLFTNDHRRASPIAESIAFALLAGNPSSGLHRIAVLTDARLVSQRSPSLGRQDFECGHLPSVPDFSQRLAHLFGVPLQGVEIDFAYVKLEPVDNNRCDATVERYQAIKTLWTDSLSRLGARVTWSMGAIQD